MRNAIKKRVIGLMSFKIYGVIFSSVDTIVISAFLGLTQLAVYNNYYYIQSTIIGFLSIITASIVAGVGNKMVTNSKEENYEDFKNIVFANGWISSWCSICLICLYQHFINLWLGREFLFLDDTMF
jgi:O-antigen/teichoic acid export membrane protein